MKIAVVGTGAMGALFAALLSPLAHVVMLGTWAEQLRRVHDPGLLLHRLNGSSVRRSIATAANPSDAAPCDIALVLVKGWQTEVAANRTRMALSGVGLAITLQNGLGNLEIVAKAVGADRAVQGVTSEGATLLGPGEVRHAGRGHTYFAANDVTRPALEQLVSLFDQAALPASIVSDARSLIWGKVAVNAAINPLTALLQVPNGYLVQSDQTIDIMKRAAQEVAVVAGRLGIMLPFDDAASQAAAVARATAGNRSSMAQDVARGMPTEIDQICGAVVDHGRSIGVPTPVNEALVHLVRAQVTRGTWRTAVDELPGELLEPFHNLAKLEVSPW